MAEGENFSEAPVTISELRSDRSERASDWTPRDALVSTLRALDKGEIDPQALLIIWSEPSSTPGATKTRFRASSQNPLATLGLARIFEWEMLYPGFSGQR